MRQDDGSGKAPAIEGQAHAEADQILQDVRR
jgi:hypothetical protein